MEEEQVDAAFLESIEAFERAYKQARSAPQGQVRVAKYYPGKPTPVTPGYRSVLIHVSSTGLGGPLSPFVLKNEQGQLLENVWQFSKLYPRVTSQHSLIKGTNTVIWSHPAEVHIDTETGEPNDAYWAWREKGMNNPLAVRYPNGYYGRTACIGAIWPGESGRLDYIQARKKIYCAEYARLAPRTPAFKALRALLEKGENLQIVEVDGPDPTLKYPPYDQISPAEPGMLMNETNIRLLVNDTNKPFGHGFVIAALLLGGEEWMK